MTGLTTREMGTKYGHLVAGLFNFSMTQRLKNFAGSITVIFGVITITGKSV